MLLAELAATPFRNAWFPWPGGGTAVGTHLVPFQCSSRGWIAVPTAAARGHGPPVSQPRTPAAPRSRGGLPRAAAGGVMTSPTAHALLAERTATPSRGWTAAAPSPTAQPLLADTAVTPVSIWALPGLGLGTTVQDRPSQCSIRVLFPVALRLLKWPTAHTSSMATACAATRTLSPVPASGL